MEKFLIIKEYVKSNIECNCGEVLSSIEKAALIFEVLLLLKTKFSLNIPKNISNYNMSCDLDSIIKFVLQNQ